MIFYITIQISVKNYQMSFSNIEVLIPLYHQRRLEPSIVMKKVLLFILLCFVPSLSNAQKVKFKRIDVPVSYVELPSSPILDPALRTYSVTIESDSYVAPGIVLEGFKKVPKEGTIDVMMKINKSFITAHTIENTEQFKKDKDGKLISQGFISNILIVYTTDGGYSITSPSEKESKFIEFGKKEQVYSKDKLPTFYHREKAEAYFNKNGSKIIKEIHEEFVASIASAVNFNINTHYGYQIPKTNYVTSFLVLKSDSHPEFTNYKAAANSIKKVFLKMRYSDPINPLREEIKPIIAYYKDVIAKYSGNKKPDKKMRSASYYNIGNIYYNLDMPNESIIYGQKIIENGVNKGKGKFMIRLAEKLEKSLSINQTDSRHMPVETIK